MDSRFWTANQFQGRMSCQSQAQGVAKVPEALRKLTPVRFLVRIAPPSADRENLLASAKLVASELGVQVRNPKWTSHDALEVDLFAASRSDVELALAALEPLGKLEFAHDLSEAPRYRTPEDAVGEARTLFNAERYWESHEVLEGIWRTLEGEEKRYVQGIILVCAAFVHHQKGEDEVGLGVLKRAASQLDYSQGIYHGIDVRRLKNSVDLVRGNRTIKPFGI